MTIKSESAVYAGESPSLVQKTVKCAHKYVIVTPVRDEEQFVEQTIRSVSNQIAKPAEWVIVDDGSKDATGRIVDQYANGISWIRVIHRKDRGFRKAGGGVIDSFYEGFKALKCQDWNFVVKLDGDLAFAEDYFEKLFHQFDEEPQLGIGGGEISSVFNGSVILEQGPRFHVRGATKIYRRECWEAIGGLHAAPGWDTIDEVKANMLGWKSETFPQFQLVQHRPTGKAEGWWRDRVKNGKAYYTAGYHPLFFAAKSLYRMTKRPYIVGAFAMCCGFLSGYLGRAVRINDAELVRYLRRQQINRLLRRQTIWK